MVCLVDIPLIIHVGETGARTGVCRAFLPGEDYYNLSLKNKLHHKYNGMSIVKRPILGKQNCKARNQTEDILGVLLWNC
jgi:hypothetical protein